MSTKSAIPSETRHPVHRRREQENYCTGVVCVGSVLSVQEVYYVHRHSTLEGCHSVHEACFCVVNTSPSSMNATQAGCLIHAD